MLAQARNKHVSMSCEGQRPVPAGHMLGVLMLALKTAHAAGNLGVCNDEALPKLKPCSRAGQHPNCIGSKRKLGNFLSQGPKCVAVSPKIGHPLKLHHKSEIQGRSTPRPSRRKTLQSGIPYRQTFHDISDPLVATQDPPNGISLKSLPAKQDDTQTNSPIACRQKRPCTLEFPKSLPELWVSNFGIHQQLARKNKKGLPKSRSKVSGFRGFESYFNHSKSSRFGEF